MLFGEVSGRDLGKKVRVFVGTAHSLATMVLKVDNAKVTFCAVNNFKTQYS